MDNAPYTYDFYSETLRSRRSFNQEFRLISDPISYESGQTFAWVVGAYYLDLSEQNDITDLGTYINPFSSRPPYIKNVTGSRDYDSENTAIFGTFDYLLSETLTLSFGMRWEDWEANYDDTFGEQFNPSDEMIGGKLSLVSQWSDDLNIYASIGRGYKAGGFNLGTGFSNDQYADTLIYDPEYLWNYELGINKQFGNSNTNLDAVVFYSDRKDQQVMASTQVDANDPNTFTFLTQNAASGNNYGLELSVKSNPTDSLNLFASIGLLKTEVNYLDTSNAQNGRAQAHAPKRSFAVGMKWFPMESVYFGMDVNGKSDFYYSDSHDNKSSSYTLANMVIG
ncbi:MAG: TonB-dependent receptor, partial [Pseudomonadota bacterium]|nr:TonB-dependent receptor [Pseudomonadota bacterium]